MMASDAGAERIRQRRSDAGVVVIYTPGMSDVRWFDRRFASVLEGAGVSARINRWCESWWPLRNLRDRDQHERAATRLIGMVRAARERRPGGEVVLVGHSTGCLIVLEALAGMIEPVARTVLLAAAVRRGYDLRPALAKTGRMVHFRSVLDPCCGPGTMLCGTADGWRRPAAGSAGFNGPGHDDGRFTEYAFGPGWMPLGHFGGHTACLMSRFARRVIVPVVRGEQWEASSADLVTW